MSEIRNVPFEMVRAEPDGDGLTLEGYAAVFDAPTEINERGGTFIERIKPGAFKRTLSHKMPVLMFNHGQHPLIGNMPLGVITEAREDARGLFIQARLSDNWLIQPVRDAIAGGAVDGMSFRFSVPKDGEVWRRARGKPDERDLIQLSCAELGPVVFPAYSDTTVGVRSQLLDALNDDNARSALAEALFAFTPGNEAKRDMGGFTFDDARPIIADAIEDQLYPDDDTGMGGCCVMDLTDTQAIYMMWEAGEMELYQIDYSIDDAGAVTLGTPTEVLKKTTYIPATDDELADSTSESPGMNSADPLDMEHSAFVPTSKELRRQGQLLLAQHTGVISHGRT